MILNTFLSISKHILHLSLEILFFYLNTLYLHPTVGIDTHMLQIAKKLVPTIHTLEEAESFYLMTIHHRLLYRVHWSYILVKKHGCFSADTSNCKYCSPYLYLLRKKL